MEDSAQTSFRVATVILEMSSDGDLRCHDCGFDMQDDKAACRKAARKHVKETGHHVSMITQGIQHWTASK